MQLAKTNDELEHLMLDPSANILRKVEDIKKALSVYGLASDEIDDFAKSVEFRDIDGVKCWTTWKYDRIRKLLSEEEFSAFLAGFGLTLELFYRMENRYCGQTSDGRPICRELDGWVCFTNTCIL